MGKDAYWFPHDSNARGDKKCIRLRRKHGWKGYGIWWVIVEQLRDEDEYRLPIDSIDDMCFDLGCDSEIILDMFEIGLLGKEGDFFFSQSLRDRMQEWDDKKQKRQQAGRLGGLKKSSNAKAKLKQSPSNALSKVKQCSSKKSTVQKSTEEDSTGEKRIKKTFCPVSSSEAPDGINPKIWDMLVECYGNRLKKVSLATAGKLGENLSDPVYAGVDVPAQIKKAAIWEDSNPTKKKTPRGIPKFLTGWMDRAQNKGGRSPQTQTQNPNYIYKEFPDDIMQGRTE